MSDPVRIPGVAIGLLLASSGSEVAVADPPPARLALDADGFLAGGAFRSRSGSLWTRFLSLSA